jgi:hypothetical protein
MLLAFSIGAFIYAFHLYEINKNLANPGSSGDIFLTDTYDSENSSFSAFLDSPDAAQVLSTVYDMLKNSDIYYYEVGFQDFYSIGNYKGDIDCVVNIDQSAVNQKINGELITPLCAIQVDSSFIKDRADFLNITEGSDFSDSDYLLSANQAIPVILGDSYKKDCQIGERMVGYYLTDKRIELYVKGFFLPNEYIMLGSKKIELNNYMIFPSPGLDPDYEERFTKILLSVKCEGMIHYNSTTQYYDAIKALERIKSDTGFQFDIPKRAMENNNLLRLSFKQSVFILLCALIFYIVGFPVGQRNIVRICAGKKQNTAISAVSASLILAIIFAAGIFLDLLIFYEKKAIVLSSIMLLSGIYFISVIFLIADLKKEMVK